MQTVKTTYIEDSISIFQYFNKSTHNNKNPLTTCKQLFKPHTNDRGFHGGGEPLQTSI